MNELFAADPLVCTSASDLKLLFASFGPYAGRYLANYPSDWATQVQRGLDPVGEIEAARIQTLLRRAKENLTLVNRLNLPWKPDQAWLANASPLLEGSSSVFEGLIANGGTPPTVHELHDVDLPPTAEERVAGTANEYARISKILLLLSPEIAFIDPYLNPQKRACSAVLGALFDLVGRGKCQKITLWTRAADVLGAGNTNAVMADMKETLQRLAVTANFKSGREIEMNLVEDESRQTKMHGRYVLSVKGGVRLDQGFQQLPNGRQVDVGPIGKVIHNELLDIFFDGRHDMRVVERIAFKV
ncbi:hypothetical protein [Rhodoferax sp.]|uniref:hypothetical protein n=1 Tax=Rhodoferax sp. TaxID=50421 RepID=UPI002622A716|nr:hypothetical protein [Rhodoferax sp.]MDD2917525.1 hypothetical protein [Rhodoferax sp.]